MRWLYKLIEDLERHGQMEDKEAAYFINHLNNQEKKLHFKGIKFKKMNKREHFASKCELRHIFSNQQMIDLAKSSE